jgi:hypothetical protein
VKIAVFGGSNTSPGEPVYESARRLGEGLAKAGHVVISGGYIGVMEGVSRGAAESGGHVIGVTCEQIENWRPVRVNPWVTEEIRCADLPQRMSLMMNSCQAALVMPGGPGTLSEVSMMWDLLLTNSIPPKPLILVGEGWQRTFETFFQSFDSFVPSSQRKWLIFSPNEEHALQLIEALSMAI